jgi:hypothetical protein
MFTLDLEKIGDDTDSVHLSVPTGHVVKLTLVAEPDDDKTPEARLSACTTKELAAEILRRLEARS